MNECNTKQLAHDAQSVTTLEALRGVIIQILQECLVTPSKSRKRKPSERNLFIGACMKRSQHPDMRQCSTEWKQTHPKKETAK